MTAGGSGFGGLQPQAIYQIVSSGNAVLVGRIGIGSLGRICGVPFGPGDVTRRQTMAGYNGAGISK